MSDLTPEMLARALDRMALISEEAEGATPPMTEPLTHESLAELRRDAESWLMIGGERVLPLLNALDAARAERDALAATATAPARTPTAPKERPMSDLTPETLAELRRLYEVAFSVAAPENDWEEWTSKAAEAFPALLDAAELRWILDAETGGEP